MAEAAAVSVASPILKSVIQKLGSGLWKEMGLASSVKKDVESLQSVLETISNVLEDAENRSIDDKTLHGWLRKLRDAAFDADDVMDEFQTEALRQKMEENCITRKVRDFFSLNNSIIFHHKIARKAKKIRARLDQISEERLRFHLSERSIPERPLERETYSFVIESEIYGRDDDKEEDAEKDSDGNVTVCKMHDLVHDLACYVVGDEAVIMEAGKDTSISHRCRYSSVEFNNDKSSECLQLTFKTKQLRSLIILPCFRVENISKLVFYVVSNLTYLRVLDLQKTGLKKLSSRISRLKHLRFLDLSETLIKALPDSITSLYNLQVLNLSNCHNLEALPDSITSLHNLQVLNLRCCLHLEALPDPIASLHNLQVLNLSFCRNLKELPKDIRKMRDLRHLCIGGCDHLTQMPPKMRQLSNLRTLSMFAVGEEDGCSIGELQDLNLIGGSLQIKNLNNVKNPKETMQANLEVKSNLQSLTLSWNEHSDWAPTPSSAKMVEDVFERLQPHPNLKELTITGYMGIKLPIWMARAELASTLFSNLVELRLGALKRCEHLPPLSQFPALKRLDISGMHALRKIEEDGGGLSVSLEEFTLSDMPELEEWRVKPTTESCPHLRLLEITSCPKLIVQPCIPSSVEHLRISRNQMLLSEGSIGGLSKLKRPDIWKCGVSPRSGWWDDGLQYLTALKYLRIEECDELNCLPEGVTYMSSLRNLDLQLNRNLQRVLRTCPHSEISICNLTEI
ncbi:putative Disease resistance protein RGA2 [Cocos nucifera]|uniref:Putative Disease resistance protein RGA2 n=1 Tax=Cocos nucifera TaxID=13894 RepID=A0A8K0I1H8_COCNU|nr:putative Disease resistance protein RGA2 [Cocos nucifera]